MRQHIESLDSKALLTTLALETSFGGDGIVRLNYGPSMVVNDAIPKSDNMVLVAGGLYGNLLVVRLKATGSRDMTFGSNGRFKYDLGGDESVTKIQPSGSGWMLTTSNKKLLRITAKGKLDRDFGIRPVIDASFIQTTEYLNVQDLGESEGKHYFVKQAESSIDYYLHVTDLQGQTLSVTKLQSLPKRAGPPQTGDWSPEMYWGPVHHFLDGDQVGAIVIEHWPGNPAEKHTAQYAWDLNGNLADEDPEPSHYAAHHIVDFLKLPNGGYLYRTNNADDEQKILMTDLGSGSYRLRDGFPGFRNGPDYRSDYQLPLEQAGGARVLARGKESIPLTTDYATGDALCVFDLIRGTKEVLRVGTQDVLISARTTQWNNEAKLLSNNRVALYTECPVNIANFSIAGTSGNDTIRIRQVGEKLQVNVNGKAFTMPSKVHDSFWPPPGFWPGFEQLLPLNINTGGGNDKVIVTGSINLSVHLGRGRDTMQCGDGNDTIEGGTGDDLIFAGGGDDSVLGGSGYDNAFGGEGNDAIFGGSENDYLDGQAGADSIFGESGDDVLIEYPTGSVDSIFGGVGNDRAYHPESQDILDSIEGEFIPPV